MLMLWVYKLIRDSNPIKSRTFVAVIIVFGNEINSKTNQ